MYWGGSDDVGYSLLVGTVIANLGPENGLSARLQCDGLAAMVDRTAQMLREAELVGDVELHMQFFDD